jgi:DNA transformation protein and related proteins
MPVSDDYIEFIRDLLARFEPLRVKRMFGGAGIYSGELFFAILIDDSLYLKVDDGNRADYEQRGLEPFRYENKHGQVATMSYFPVPPELIDDPDDFAPWVRKALEAAQRGAAKPARKGR